jgi:hypothetical protein
MGKRDSKKRSEGVAVTIVPEHKDDVLRVQLSIWKGLGGNIAKRVEFTFDGPTGMKDAKAFVGILYRNVSKSEGICWVYVYCNEILQPMISGPMIPGEGAPIWLL